MAGDYKFTPDGFGFAGYEDTYVEPATRNLARLSDGTMIATMYSAADGDLEFWYSDDQGFSWTVAATVIAMTTPSTTTGHTLWVADDDTIWVTYCENSGTNWYMQAFTWTGTDVSNQLGATLIRYSIEVYKGGDLIVFTDPDDDTKYRVLVAGYTSSSVARVWDYTVTKDWVTVSGSTLIWTSSSAASGSYEIKLVLAHDSTDHRVPASASAPAVHFLFKESGSIYTKKLTYSTGSPGSWTVGTQYTVVGSHYLTQAFYDPESGYVIAACKGWTTQGSIYYGDSSANFSQLGGGVISGMSALVGPFLFELNGERYGRVIHGTSYSAHYGMVRTVDLSGGFPGTWDTASTSGTANLPTTIAGSAGQPAWPSASGPDNLPRMERWLDPDGGIVHNYCWLGSGGDFMVMTTDGHYGLGTRVTPTIRSTSVSVWNETSSLRPLTVSKPSGVVEGDLLLCFFLTADYPTLTSYSQFLYLTNGWNLCGPLPGQEAHTSGYRTEPGVFWRIAGASEPSTYDFSWSGDGSGLTGGAVALVALSSDNCSYNPNNPIQGGDIQSKVNTSSTTFTHNLDQGSLGLQIIANIAAFADASGWSGYAKTLGNAFSEDLDTQRFGIASREVTVAEMTSATDDIITTLGSGAEGRILSVTVAGWAGAAGAGGIGWGIAL